MYEVLDLHILCHIVGVSSQIDRTQVGLETMVVKPYGWVTKHVSVLCAQTGRRFPRTDWPYYRGDHGCLWSSRWCYEV